MKNWVYIGRFQPFHNGHLDVLHQIADKMAADDTLTLILGSTGSGSPRNPLDPSTRYDLIQNILDNDKYLAIKNIRNRINIHSLCDSAYNWTMFGKWLQWVLSLHNKMRENILCGMEYIKEYADLVGVPYWQAEERIKVHATDIRKAVANNDEAFLKANLPEGVFADEELYDEMKAQIMRVIKAQQKYINDLHPKYPSVYKTVDNIVLCAGHILFVVRKDNGKYAMPGGFQDPTDFSAEKGAVRELREETGLDSSGWTPAAEKAFDAPYRDPRCSEMVNAVTTAFLYRINPTYEQDENGVMHPVLPHVEGKDDAAAAVWVPLSEVCMKPENAFHADHQKIILNMLGLEPRT